MLKKLMLRLRLLILFALTLLLAFHVNAQDATPTPTPLYSISFEDLTRTYRLYVPDSYDGTEAVPIVFVLHGGRQDVRAIEAVTLRRFNELAEEHGFIVVYPSGVENRWNDGRDIQNVRAYDENINDVGFISALIDHLAAEYAIDEGRIYATGLSNGAVMSIRLACDLSARIVAVAPVAGLMPANRVEECLPEVPVSVMIIAGQDDPLTPYEGGDLAGGAGSAISAEATALWWANYNECEAPEHTALPDTADDETTIELDLYAPCEDDTEVALYTVIGGGHTFPGGLQYRPVDEVGRTSLDMVAADVIWTFFSNHSRTLDD